MHLTTWCHPARKDERRRLNYFQLGPTHPERPASRDPANGCCTPHEGIQPAPRTSLVFGAKSADQGLARATDNGP
jgi:hypothetical protein